MVQPKHGGEVLFRQIRRRLHRDIGIGVGGIAHDKHPNGAFGHGVEGLALGGKDLCIGRQQILALHPRAPRPGADQQRDVDIFEGGHGVAVRCHPSQEREGAVIDFHHDAF